MQLLPEPQLELLVPAVQRGLLLAGVLPAAGARGVQRGVLPGVRARRDGAAVEGGRRRRPRRRAEEDDRDAEADAPAGTESIR